MYRDYFKQPGIYYGEMTPLEVRRLLEKHRDEVLVFCFGVDMDESYKGMLSGYGRMDNIEQLSIILGRMLKSPEFKIKKILVHDCYAMQAKDRTPQSKGIMVKGIVSFHSVRIERRGISLLFASEIEDVTTKRHVERYANRLS